MPCLLVRHRTNEPNLCFKEGIATSTFETGYHSKSITVRVCEGMGYETSLICTLIVSVSNLLHENHVDSGWKCEKFCKGITQVLVELRRI